MLHKKRKIDGYERSDMDLTTEKKEDEACKHLYVCLISIPQHWYRLDLVPDSKPDELPLSLPPPIPGFECNPELYSGIRFIDCGSKLYGFGGCYWDGDTSIIVCDPKARTLKKLDVKMETIRSEPSLVVKDDKLIYILGNFGTRQRHYSGPWAEVFDTESGTLESLPQPPDALLSTHYLDFSTVHEDKVYVVIPNEVFTYDTKDKSWMNVSDLHPEFPVPCRRSVSLGTTLFNSWRGKLFAYDFPTKTIHLVEGLGDYTCWGRGPGAVFDLGNGKLCVVWNAFLKGNYYLHVLVCEPIREISNGSPVFTAKNISSVKYSIGKRYNEFEYAAAL